MRFRRASFTNFRLLRDLELEFSTDSKSPLTVIRAENETGKTTILNALQWTLFGEEGLPTRGASYRIIPIDWDTSASKAAEIVGELEFEHTFERPDGKGGWIQSTDEYLVRRTATEMIRGPSSWKRNEDSFQLFKKDQSGYTPEKSGELFVRQIMGSNLKDLFFTDGDRALSFITSEVPTGEKRKMVRKAIRDMLGFELLENALSHVKKSAVEIRGEVKQFSGADELNALQEKMRRLEEKEAENNKRLSEIDGELKQVNVDVQMIEQKLERALERGNREELVKQKQLKQSQLSSARTRLEALRREHGELFKVEPLGQFLLKDHIAKASKILNDLKAKGRIPRTAIPVLRERLEMRECICGEVLEPGSVHYQHVQDLIVQQEAASVVDDRLTDLRLIANQKLLQVSTPSGDWGNLANAIIQRRNDFDKQIADLESELKTIESKINELPETDIGFLREQKRARLEHKEELTREHGIRLSDRERLIREKKNANEEWKVLTTQQKRFKKVACRLDAATDIADVLAASYKSIEDSEVPRVCNAMNDYFLSMIQADPENSIIRKADISEAYDIVVYGPQDRLLDTDLDLNGASRRALTLAFILALTEVSGVKAPNIIDTPLGMMSGIVKQSVLRTAVSHTAQLILFLTRDEISGCEDIIDLYAGKVFTLSNSAHYPKQLVNNTSTANMQALLCDCNHRQYCDVCERIGDGKNARLTQRN
ncbi:MAG: AAA family ATPase [Chloroflexi bacterium]|nr:AAA family ATPase [Chloroflexota bacterium]